MLRGRFGDTTGRPYIEGRLVLLRLNIKGDVSFLVDTGADRSLFNPLDGVRMNIDYPKLQGSVEAMGIGGLTRHYEEPALIIFTEPRRYLHVYSVKLAVCPPGPKVMTLPSLLGRDILDKWRMIYDPGKKRLRFSVVSSDFSMPVSP